MAPTGDEVYDRQWVEPATEWPADARGDPMHATLTPAIPDFVPSASPMQVQPGCPRCDEGQEKLDEQRRRLNELRTALIDFFFPETPEDPSSISRRMIELLLEGATREELERIRDWMRIQGV